MSGPVLQTSGLGKRYRSVWALRDCDLAVPAGRVIAVVGPTGAGKTTFLRLAVGLLRPTEGEITVLGSPAGAESAESLAEIGFVAQDHPLYQRFRVRDLLRTGAALNLRWDQVLAEGRLDSLEISLDRPIGTLSGGQHAQVALTLALAKRPRLLVLDEPVAGLAPVVAAAPVPVSVQHREVQLRRTGPVGLLVLAVATGILGGALIKRTLPAMAATLAVFLPIRLAVEFWLRPRYMTPVTAVDPVLGSGALTQQVSQSDNWVLDTYLVGPSGQRLSDADEFRLLGGGIVDEATLAQHGLKEAVSYHPASRYWDFQLIETAIFGGLALAFALLVIWRIRHWT